MAEQKPQPPPPANQRVAAIAAALVAGAAVAGAAAAPPVLTAAVLAALVRLFTRWGYRRETVRHAARMLTVTVRTTREPTPPGPAGRADARNRRVFTAWFLERSTARVEAAYAAGATPGEPEAREQRFLEQHLLAQQRRRQAAKRVDAEAEKPGQVTDKPWRNDDGGTPGDPDGIMSPGPRVILKWRAHPDDKTTIECAAADGAWFYADTPPVIGYPGMPHGGTCRCWSTNAGSLKAVARGRTVNEAVRDIIKAEPDHRAHPGAIPRRTPRTA